MIKTGLVAMMAVCGLAMAQEHGAMACCAKHGTEMGHEMASCGKGGLSKDEIKAQLKQAQRELKLSDAKIDKIAAALASAKHECCAKAKTAESSACCE